MTALAPRKRSFVRRKPMCCQHLYFRAWQVPSSARSRGQDPEGQRSSALTQTPQFAVWREQGGAALGLEGSQGSGGQFHPTQAAGEVPGTACEEPPARLPHSGLPGGRLPGAPHKVRGLAAPTAEARDSRRPGEQRSEATPGRAPSATQENAARNRHSGRRRSPHGGATWYLPPPPTPSSGFTPPPHTRHGAWPQPHGFPRPLIHIHEGETGGPSAEGRCTQAPPPVDEY